MTNVWEVLSKKFFVIAGPCVIESRDHAMFMAMELQQAAARCGVTYVFKASYDKANRTSIKSFLGPGIDGGLKVLDEIRRELRVPVLTDIHEVDQAAAAAEVVDILQIPAFLSRQTDLIIAAAKTGKIVNVKKGQ